MVVSDTILLDIYERLGAIENELKSLKKKNDDSDVEIKELKEFKNRIAAYIWLGGSIASGVLFFLYEGVKYGAEIWLRGHS